MHSGLGRQEQEVRQKDLITLGKDFLSSFVRSSNRAILPDELSDTLKLMLPVEFGEIPIVFRARRTSGNKAYQEMQDIYSANSGNSYEIWFENKNRKWSLNFRIIS